MFSRHAIVPMRALKAVSAGDLTPVDICVLAALGAHIAAANESLEDWVWPSLAHLADLIGKSEATVFRSVQRLEDGDWIERDVCFSGEGRGRKKTYYRLIFDAPVDAATARSRGEDQDDAEGPECDGAMAGDGVGDDQLAWMKVGRDGGEDGSESEVKTGSKPGQDQLSKRADQLSKTHDQLSKRGDQLSSHSMKGNRNRNSKTRARDAPARGRHRSGQPPDGASGSVFGKGSGDGSGPVGLHGDLVSLARGLVASDTLVDKWMVAAVAAVEVSDGEARVLGRTAITVDRLSGPEFQTLWPIWRRELGVKRVRILGGDESYLATGPPDD